MVSYSTCNAGLVAATDESTEKKRQRPRKKPAERTQTRERQRRDLRSDASAVSTPFAPGGNGGATARPSRSGSPVDGAGRSRTGTFDVHVSSGPLGIVIDTMPEGPVIDSLKPASQLRGRVGPGDLIVGLDGVSTRNMTAATFTRLVAERGRVRKISLLPGC